MSNAVDGKKRQKKYVTRIFEWPKPVDLKINFRLLKKKEKLQM